MNQLKALHLANAKAIDEFAGEAGAEILRGDLRYPSYSGGWQPSDIDLSEHLAKYREHEIVIVIASVGKAGEWSTECSQRGTRCATCAYHPSPPSTDRSGAPGSTSEWLRVPQRTLLGHRVR